MGSGTGGALYAKPGPVEIQNSVFVNNAAWIGGAILVDTEVDIINCTIVNNYANETSGQGGGIFCATSGAAVVNSIVRGNVALDDPQADQLRAGRNLLECAGLAMPFIV